MIQSTAEPTSQHAVVFGFVLNFASNIGQTFFISLFSGELRAELGMSHGRFGTLYSLATVSSGAILLYTGRMADRVNTTMLSVLTLLGLAGSALALGFSLSALSVFVSLLGLRLCGQGMLSHISLTAMARWFARSRGRALSLASMGFLAGEAVLPTLVAIGLVHFSWRVVWAATAALVLGILLPATIRLGRQLHRSQIQNTSASVADTERPSTGWNVASVLRDPRFYVLLPGVLAPPFIVTGVLFHQVHLVETKGWTLSAFAASYPLLAASAAAMALAAGWVIDRFGALRILPFYLLPLAVGLVVLAGSESLITAPVFMLLMGCTSGSATIVIGALWPEIYGVTHLGAIRAVATSLSVFSTALAPGLIGALLDGGIPIEDQLLAMALYAALCAGIFALLRRWYHSIPSPSQP